MISFQDINVSFSSKDNMVEAVKNVTFEINDGEIFGIVGTSGAGKSTLLRTINLLQKPSSGSVVINGTDIARYVGEHLRQHRLKTGMIFQHFNLIHTKSVYENVAFSMKAAGKSKQEIKDTVTEVLELVGLSEKSKTYPAKLSGGQNQRVGIARAIVNNPQILLCDEPTSALDLESTNSILELLKKINRQLGITTVIISHEMSVIKKICDRVAVMKDGEVVELNNVYDIFATPKHPFTRQLVNHTLNLALPERTTNDGLSILKLVFRGESAEQPILSETIKRFDVDINILHGKIEYISEYPIGILIVKLDTNKEKSNEVLTFLKERVAEVEVLYGHDNY